MKRACIVIVMLALLAPLSATAHYTPENRAHQARHAIQLAWCGKANVSCFGSRNAWLVAGCETGYTYSPYAGYGKHQYLGIFQMGDWARRNYGHANNVWGQARAAHRLYVAAGWSQWECSPYGAFRDS